MCIKCTLITFTESMIFLVASTDTPRAPTPISMYLNIKVFTLSCTSIKELTRMFLAFSVLLSSRFWAISLARGEAVCRSISEESDVKVGGESW